MAAKPGPKTPPPLSARNDLLGPPSLLGGLTLVGIKKALGSGEVKRRLALVKTLLQATTADAPTLHRWLHRKVETPVADMKNVLLSIGATVPDHRGRFTAEAKIKDLDWLKALLDLDPAKLSKGLGRALDECLLTVILLRATAASGHPDAAVSIVRLGYRHKGAFRDQCGRQIRAMGVAAVPGLVRLRNLKDQLGFKMVRYGSYQMDRMNWTRPGRVLKLAGPDLRAELLHAYGEVRDTSAVGTVLRYTDDGGSKVRRAARWAMLRYVSGRPPSARKRKLKLVGGRKTERARTVYYTYQQLASHALAGRLAEELSRKRGRPAGEIKKQLLAEVEPRHLAERLFALQDRKLERTRSLELKGALELARRGKLKQALGRFDRILAAAPFHPRRHEMAIYYFKQGEELYRSGGIKASEGALLLLTKSIHLSPEGEFIPEARALRLVAEALSEPESSPTRETRLARALALVPGHQRATRELDRLHSHQRSKLLMAGGVGGSIAICLVLGLSFFWRRMS